MIVVVVQVNASYLSIILNRLFHLLKLELLNWCSKFPAGQLLKRVMKIDNSCTLCVCVREREFL